MGQGLRSLRDLTQHLTTRADDSHAPPVILPVRESQSQKTGLSSDRGLQLDLVKAESLVIPDQHAGVNTFPGLVHTARHTTKVCCT